MDSVHPDEREERAAAIRHLYRYFPIEKAPLLAEALYDKEIAPLLAALRREPAKEAQ